MKRLLFALGFVLSACLPAFSQTYSLLPIPKLNYLSNSGAILPNARLCSFAAGSTTPQTTYQDAAGTANTNPVVFDSYGRANVWGNSNAYKLVLYGRLIGAPDVCPYTGTLLWSADNIRDYGLVALESGFITGSGTSGNCAQWSATTVMGDAGQPCGTIAGSGTVGTLSKFFTDTQTIADSRVTEDLSGGPGFYALKVNERLLVNGTASDVTTGASVFLGTITEVNSASNAVAIRMYTAGGGSGRAIIDSFHTGSGTTKPLSLQIDGTEKLEIDTTGQVLIDALKTTGSAGSKKVVCVDTATGQLYASSTAVDCSN